MALSVTNLGVRLGAAGVLEGVSFEAQSGMMHALVGPNGAGKTTLLRALGAMVPYDGSARFHEQELGRVAPENRARWMAYVPQFLPGVALSVLEVLELSRRPFGTPAKERALIERQIATFELEPLLSKPLERLSGGQRQMVMLAAALLQTPKLLLLDEPIAHLDPKNRLEVLQRLRSATKEQEITTLIVLHDLQHALHYCDTLLLLREGRLLGHTPASELDAAHLGTLYGVQTRLFWDDGHPYVAFAHRHNNNQTSHQHKG